MAKEVTTAVEEYLECIYRLQEKDGAARTSEVAKLLGVVPGTIINTVKRLEKDGLVTREPYKGVKLTEEGRRIALRVIRRHRLSERLLTDILHVEWENAHEEACRFEHVITNDVEKSIVKALSHPNTCPHGNPIPTKCGGIFEEESVPLTSLNIQEGGTIVKITEERCETLRYLRTLGLIPGAFIRVVRKAPFNGPITVDVNGANHALSHKVASIINVKKV